MSGAVEARDRSPATGPLALHRVRTFPELAAGGFSRIDAKVAFYLRVNALLRPDMTVLDFGAGRGAQVNDPNPFRAELARLRGKARKVIGVDLDRAIHRNPDLDEAHVLQPTRDGAVSLPLADGAVDLVVSTFVFEHVSNPGSVAAELDRVLRTGGWICALTPNAFGYIGLGNRITPEPLKAVLLRRLQPRRRDEDVFPTVYRLNTGRALRRHFPPSRWLHASYTHDPEPTYAGDSSWLWGLTRIVNTLTPPAMRSLLIVLLRKETP